MTRRGYGKDKLRPAEPLYHACENMDLSFFKHEINRAIELYREGVHYADIAAHLARDGDEVAILLIDLLRKKKIMPREGGCYGTVRKDLGRLKRVMPAGAREAII
jgi:hypothetical protein